VPVVQATQTFTGIENENEFYSHYFLAEVFLGNIRAQLDRWNEAEAAEGGPRARPASCAPSQIAGLSTAAT
jgi:hypothetical protein